MVKGYAKKESVDFNEIFSLVILLISIWVILSMCARFDLQLEQLDVKITFLHRELDEKIYMLKLEGLKKMGKRTWFIG